MFAPLLPRTSGSHRPGPTLRWLPLFLLLGCVCAFGGDDTLFPVVPVRLVSTAVDFRHPASAEREVAANAVEEAAVLDGSESFTILREVVLPGILISSPRPVVVVGLGWLWREFSGPAVDIRVLLPNAELRYRPVGTDERLGILAAEPATAKAGNPQSGISVMMAGANRVSDVRWVCIPGEEAFRITRARTAKGSGRLRWDPIPDKGVPPFMLPIFTSEGDFDGFCIPMPDSTSLEDEWAILDRERVLGSVQQIVEHHGSIRTGYLGVYVEDILPKGSTPGVLIKGVTKGSPAQGAGLAPGDIIVKIDQTPITSAREFIRTLQELSPTVHVSISALRGGKPLRAETVLGTVPPPPPPPIPVAPAAPLMAHSIMSASAMRFTPQPDGKPSIGVSIRNATRTGVPGAEVTFVLMGSPAAEAGIQPGDVFVEVGGKAVRSLDDFAKAMSSLPPRGTPVPVRVLRSGSPRTLRILPR